MSKLVVSSLASSTAVPASVAVTSARRTIAPLLLATLVGCSSGSVGGDGATDTGVGQDSSGGHDGSPFDTTPPDDANVDATPDATADSTTDSPSEATPDGATDTVLDTPSDGATDSPAEAASDAATDAPTDACSTSCAPGATSCDGNAVRTCVSVAGCTVYSDPVACPGTEVCSAGSCAASCTDKCTAGTSQCSGANIQTCAKGASGCTDWSTPVACDSGKTCSVNACVLACTDACAPGDKKCADPTSTQLCAKQPSGCYDYAPASLCPSGGTCSGAGNCVACTSGTMRCGTSGGIEQCEAGTWTAIGACTFGCKDGACATAVSCSPGGYRCDGGTVEVCNSSGTAYLYTSTCAGGCTAGLCTGSCTPGATRCNAGNSEQCNAGGTGWAVAKSCTGSCDAVTGACTIPSLVVDPTTTVSFDGVYVVDGDVIVKTGSTMYSKTGDLTIRAKTITVESGGSITVASTGQSLAGRGADGVFDGGSFVAYGGGGGGYGESASGAMFGDPNDAIVSAGAAGGTGGHYSTNAPGAGGQGGGVIRLIADTITIAGQVTANGENGHDAAVSYAASGGGGSGGGILVAADKVNLTGSLSAAAGNGGAVAGGAYPGSNPTGGRGRVKVLYGSGGIAPIKGSVIGIETLGLLPPLLVTSSTHPSSQLVYNDDFPTFAMTWGASFPSRQGYYMRLDTAQSTVPAPANAKLDLSELTSFGPDQFFAGSNYFHIVSIDSTSTVGLVQNWFQIQINTTPPTLASSSHPSSTTWSTTADVFYNWTLPTADSNYLGCYYILDHYGRTVPTKAATFLPITQKQLIRSGLANGVWGFHVDCVDTMGYPTKASGDYVVRLGTDPGSGAIVGQIVDASAAPVTDATVTLNRGLLVADAHTDGSGNYSFPATVPAGSWELMVTSPTHSAKTIAVTVKTGATTTANTSVP